MMNGKRWLMVLVLVALGIGIGFRLWSSRTAPDASPAVQALYASRLADLDGRAQPVSQWRGKVAVINFWAPWCGPCREEVPALIHAYNTWRSRDVVMLGIAVDTPQNVRQFNRQYRINYPLLLGDANTLDLTAKLGNTAGGLPYTVIINPRGQVVATFLGGLTQQKLDAVLAPLVSPAKGA